MATYFRDLAGFAVQKSEATAAYRTVYFEVGTVEAQTVTVSKNGAAFATATSTAAQVDSTLYALTIAAADIDTAGVVAFKCAGATDTQYLMNIRVVDHDPVEAVQDILDDTSGTDGVALADDAITAAKIADDAIGADQLATDAIGSDALAATATAEIADAVLTELVSDHKSTSGSFADVLNDIWRRVGFGLIRWDTAAETLKTYDGDADSDTLLLTQTRSESGTETDYTPS